MLKSKEAEQEYQRYKAGIAASERLYKEELAKNGDRSGNEKRIVTDARSFAERRSSLAAYRRIKKRITMLYDRLETEKQFGEAHNPRTSFYDYYCKEYLSIGKEYNRVFHADDAAINEAVASLLRSVDSMLVAAQKRTEAGYEENKLDYAKRLKEINSALVNLDSQISKENRGENLPVAEATEVIDEIETKARAQLTLGQALLMKENKNAAKRYFQKVVDEWPKTKAAETAHQELHKLGGN